MKRKNLPLGRPSVLRHTNAHSILKLLRDFGSCSRADLVRASGLSAPTVTNVVKDLLLKGLVEPLGEGESSGGRPPDMIRFHAERGCLLAVQILSKSLSFLLTDLNGIELETCTLPLADCSTTPAAICGYIERELKLLAAKTEEDAGSIIGRSRRRACDHECRRRHCVGHQHTGRLAIRASSRHADQGGSLHRNA